MRRGCLSRWGGRGHVWWVWGECGGDVVCFLRCCIFRGGGGAGERGRGAVDRKGDIKLYVIIIFSLLCEVGGKGGGEGGEGMDGDVHIVM